MNEPTIKNPQPDRTYFLSELLGSGIYATYDCTKRIGRLVDATIVEKGTIPHVMELVVARPFGEPGLLIPIDRIEEVRGKTIVVAIESLAKYEGRPSAEAMLLRDYILDKKIIDTADRDVSVVYDIKIIQINKKLYVSDVELNRYGLLKRIGLRWVAELFKIREDTVSWKYIQPLPGNISGFRGSLKLTTFKDKLGDIPPVDMADIVEELNQEQRTLLISELDPAHASDTFEEVDPNVQRELVSSLDKTVVARLIDDMTPGQAADVISALPHADKQNLLGLIRADLSKKIQAILNHQEESIENYATKKFVRATVYDSVEKAKNEFVNTSRTSDVRHYVYIVDSFETLQGIIDIAELLTHENSTMVRDIMTDKIVSLTSKNTLKEATELFDRYGFRALPLLDDKKTLLGVITNKDMINLRRDLE